MAVARALGMEPRPLEERDFEDGEHKSRPLDDVRGADAYVVRSLHGDESQSVNDKLCRLLFLVGTLKDAGARRVTAVTPYLCYARKDRKTNPRDPVTTRYVAQVVEAVGADGILTVDVHDVAAYQNSFRRHSEHLEARLLFAEHIASHYPDDDFAVVSPDAGGIKRAEAFRRTLAERLGRAVDAGFMEKWREGGEVSGEALTGKVEGRTTLLFDDMISTGGTMARAARACRGAGAARCFAVATHGLFLPGAEDVIEDESLEGVVVTNTVPPFRVQRDAARGKLEVLDAAPLVAEGIARLHDAFS